MTYLEHEEVYGTDAARRVFGLTDHGVFIVRDGYTMLRCGTWTASEPGTYEEARHKLQKLLGDALEGMTFEVLS